MDWHHVRKPTYRFLRTVEPKDKLLELRNLDPSDLPRTTGRIFGAGSEARGNRRLRQLGELARAYSVRGEASRLPHIIRRHTFFLVLSLSRGYIVKI